MRMTRGVRLLGVALLVLLLGGVDELGIGSGRFGCGGVMAQMNRDGEKEDEKSGLPPSDGAEKQAPKEEEEEEPQTDTRSSLSNRDLSAENQQLRADNAQLTETNQVLVAKDEEYKKRVVELELEVERLRADCAERPSPDAGKQELPPREEHADLAEKLTQYMEDLTASRHREELLQAQVTSLTAIAAERVTIPGMETAALQPPCSKEVELAAKKRIASMAHAIQVMTNDERHNVILKEDETGRLQQELRDLNASYALAQQKVQRHKRNEMITGIVLGLVFPLLALLGVLLYLYWQRRRSDVLSSADAAATSSLMDQETELVNRRTGSRPDEDHNGLRNSLTETGGGGAFEDICF